MTIKEVKDKNIWEDFLSGGKESKLSSSPFAVAQGCEEKTFLQSWNWGEFQILMGNKIWRLGIFNDNGLVLVALVLKITARRGTFLLVPHGPNIRSEIVTPKVVISKILLEKIKEIGKEEKVDFIRISPIWEKNEENNRIFKDLGFKPAPIHMHPEASWKLDIRPSVEELLINMRKTTRYLIRQAQRDNNIEVFQSKSIEDVRIFNGLHSEVVKVQRFVPFSLDYLKKEFLAFQQDNQISIFFGKHKGEVIAASYVLFWSGIGFYHHAALLPKFHKIPVSYLLQWEVLKEAKKRGCVLYDFWGYVDPKTQAKHPWAGPTLFKMGFGGRPFEYVKTQDFPLSRKYWLTYIFEKLRRAKRGL